MKGISKLSWLTFIVCLMSVLSANAEDCQTPKTESPTKSGEGILYSLEYNTDRKRMPSRNVLELYYDNETISFQSETCQGCFSLEMSCVESMQSYGIPAIAVGESVYLDMTCGEYDVTAIREDGIIFKGVLLIQ